jgi:hypothetical protein
MNNSVVTSSRTFKKLQDAIDARYAQYQTGLINLGEYCSSVQEEVDLACEQRLANAVKNEITGLPMPEYELVSRYANAWRFCEALRRDLDFHLSKLSQFK